MDFIRIRREAHLEKLGPVFEFFKGRFGFLRSQNLKRTYMDTLGVRNTLSEHFLSVFSIANLQ